MTEFGRLKDVFLDRAPERVLGCTYGFEPDFFEQEVLPAMLPELTLDRGAGNTASYLHAGDEVLRSHPIVICCDHYEPGRELPYNLIRVRASTAFHPKLLLLDYGERLRAVVASANLTRSGWSTALELFVFEDLEPGSSHPWAEPLTRFVRGVKGLLRGEDAKQLQPFMRRFAQVKRPKLLGKGGSLLISTFDAPLINAISDEVAKSDRIDVVTPFLEGDEGAGVFDKLGQTYPDANGTLYVRAEDADGTPTIRGPKEKIEKLINSGNWRLRRVKTEWQGDEEDAPPRALHGKLLTLRDGKRGVALMGSANVTRAALLGKFPGANVELGVLVSGKQKLLDALLPQSDELALSDVEILPAEEDPDEPETPADWIESAVYQAGTSTLELTFKARTPPVDVVYAERELARNVQGPTWSSKLRLGKSLDVLIRSKSAEAIVPFLVLDLELMEPRGMSRKPGLDELLDIMAGAREAVDSGEEPPGPSGGPDGGPERLLQAGSAFAWRRMMRGLAGLEQDLIRAGPFEIEVRRLLDGPLGARALIEALQELTAGDSFVDADFAFAVHQMNCTLLRARSAIIQEPRASKEAVGHLDRWIKSLRRTFDDVRKSADQRLKTQLNVIRRELAASG